MNIYIIYKQTLDMDGNTIKVDLVECDTNDGNAARFTKLYNLQIPSDFKSKTMFSYIGVRIR
jgi:hypothetical protein